MNRVTSLLTSILIMLGGFTAMAHDTTFPSEIILIVDRSGPMANIVDDMKPALDKFVTEQKELGEEGAKIRMIQFDNVYEEYYNGLLEFAPSVQLDPRDRTALYDALGKTLSSVPDDERTRIIFIVTDGLENASVEWSRDSVSGLMDKFNKNCHTSVTYLGSNQDAILAGGEINIWHGGSITFTNDASSINSAVNTGSSATTTIRTGDATGFNYTDEERDDAVADPK